VNEFEALSRFDVGGEVADPVGDFVTLQRIEEHKGNKKWFSGPVVGLFHHVNMVNGAALTTEELPELVPDEIFIVMKRYAREKDRRNLYGFESHNDILVFE
tara:strand:+ start:486 stop:788 length:303 start_codon:yes stop_codon:yes gene_type:complete